MEIREINGNKYYVAYKGFENDTLRNYQGNFTYKLNKMYKALDVDMSNDDCSYGLNLFQTIEECKRFFNNICIIYECLVPIDDNKIKFIKGEDKFRCLKFYLTNKVVYDFYNQKWMIDIDKYWNELTERQRFFVCMYILNLDIDKYWNELTKYQKYCICKYNYNFDIDKYWNKLTKYQRDLVCINNPNLDIDKYWNELTEDQRDLVCINNPNLDIDKYWNELTEYQRDCVCACNPNFDIDKYWNELTEYQREVTKEVQKKNVVIEEEYFL